LPGQTQGILFKSPQRFLLIESAEEDYNCTSGL
jgi:hypothetical protein